MMAVSIDEEVDELFPEETTVEMDEPSETEAPAVVNLIARSVSKYMPKPGSKSSSKMMEFSATFAIALCQLRAGILLISCRIQRTATNLFTHS